MHLEVTFRNLKPREEVRQRSQVLFEKLERFLDESTDGHLIIGLICSGIVAAILWFTGIEVTFDMTIRDVLLLVFFSTIGLSAKFSTLKEGGKALAILVVIAAAFLLVQNSTGVGLALLFDVHPGYGLMAGSMFS